VNEPIAELVPAQLLADAREERRSQGDRHRLHHALNLANLRVGQLKPLQRASSRTPVSDQNRILRAAAAPESGRF
jgi:hypothetical protein